MFGSRRNPRLALTPKSPSADFESSLGSDFQLLLSKREFRPGEMVTFEVNAKNGNAVRLNLLCQLMQTTVFLRRGKFRADRKEIGSVLSQNTFQNMVWRDQVYIPPPTPVSKSVATMDRADMSDRVVEIKYTLVLSSRVESVMLIRDEAPITIVPWVFGPNSNPAVAGPSSVPEMSEFLMTDVPVIRMRRELNNRSPPPRYSMLSIHSAFAGSMETLPPTYEDVTK